MMAAIGQLFAAFLVGGCGWMTVEFIAKPIRKFFDLRTEVRRQMILLANVRAQWKEDHRTMAIPLGGDAELSPAEIARLHAAEETYRDLGAQVSAFADVETPSLYCLRLFGYAPHKAGSALIGLSNALSTYGSNRAAQTAAVEVALRINRK